MKKSNIPPFNVNLLQEGNYHRLYVTHPFLKGRFKKRIGNGKPENLEKIRFHLKYELENHFETSEINLEAVNDFINSFISLQVKYTASIFMYFEEFIQNEQETTYKELITEPVPIPEKIEKAPEVNDKVLELSRVFENIHNALYLGRGWKYLIPL